MSSTAGIKIAARHVYVEYIAHRTVLIIYGFIIFEETLYFDGSESLFPGSKFRIILLFFYSTKCLGRICISTPA